MSLCDAENSWLQTIGSGKVQEASKGLLHMILEFDDAIVEHDNWRSFVWSYKHMHFWTTQSHEKKQMQDSLIYYKNITNN